MDLQKEIAQHPHRRRASPHSLLRDRAVPAAHRREGHPGRAAQLPPHQRTQSTGWADRGSALQRPPGAGKTFDQRAAHFLHHHGGRGARNAAGEGTNRCGADQGHGSHDCAHVIPNGAKMKWIRPSIALAVLAGFALRAPYPGARAKRAASFQQAATKSCGTVTVAAASDLTYAMNEIAANFEKATGCTVRLSMGSSGNFLTQIENGGPFDVFLSADIAYPKKLEDEGLAAPGSTYLYAIGKIVLWTRNDSRVDVSKGFSALRDPAVRKIAIANPAHAPYGRAAEEALRQAGIYDAVKDRLAP